MDRKIDLKQLNLNEALRYLGYKDQKPDEKMTEMLNECSAAVLSAARAQMVYRVFELKKHAEVIEVEGTNLRLPGNAIRLHLEGCRRAVLFAATVSGGVDRLIRQAQLTDMARAVVIDSLATVAIEQVCDQTEQLLRQEFPNAYQTFRFGVGYGDFPITIQKDFITVLNASKQIGLHVNASSMLIPSKSVTAVIGLSDNPIAARARGCQTCSMREHCSFREKGGRCNG